MNLLTTKSRFFITSIALLMQASATAQSQPRGYLDELAGFPHAVTVTDSNEAVIDYEIGLGAIQKVRGSWRFKHSERHSGQLSRHTWQIVDGFSSQEVMLVLEEKLRRGSELLYSCDGRSCGQGVQWANRVFSERVLYGREDLQSYRVYGPGLVRPGSEGPDPNGPEQAGGPDYRVLIFSAARTADRQYLHVELLEISDQEGR